MSLVTVRGGRRARASCRERAACAARACPARCTRSSSRAVCACLFLSLEVAHFRFLVPVGSSACPGSARVCVCVCVRPLPAIRPQPAGRALGPEPWRQARHCPATPAPWSSVRWGAPALPALPCLPLRPDDTLACTPGRVAPGDVGPGWSGQEKRTREQAVPLRPRLLLCILGH